MKHTLLLCLMVLQLSFAFAQTEAEKFKDEQLHNKDLSEKDLKEQLIKHDFSNLFTNTDNSVVYGFIGDNYQRIRIKFIKVTKDTLSAYTYHIYGKSMVKNNVDEFTGTIKISNILKFKPRQHGCEDEYKYKGYKGEFVLLGNYNFGENTSQNHSGIFKGSFRSDFFINKNNQVRYNDIEDCSDSYTNNQFVGQWIEYKTNLTKRCNWGDFRVPNSGDLDMGAGEFSPADKYLKYGWQSRRDNNEEIENARWWK